MAYGSGSYGSTEYGSSGQGVTTFTVTFTLDKILLKNVPATFSLDAWLVYCTAPGGTQTTIIRNQFPITFDAILQKTIENSFTLDANLIRFAGFTIDGILINSPAAEFTLDAWLVYRTSPCPGAVTDDITTGTIYGTDGIKNW